DVERAVAEGERAAVSSDPGSSARHLLTGSRRIEQGDLRPYAKRRPGLRRAAYVENSGLSGDVELAREALHAASAEPLRDCLKRGVPPHALSPPWRTRERRETMRVRRAAPGSPAPVPRPHSTSRDAARS